MTGYVTRNEIACKSFANAITLAEILLKEEYVVMLSREENLTIVNYIWSEREADRNDVVFLDRGEFEDEFFKRED